MENNKKSALAIFCRAPRLGEVKTRIARTDGAAFALELYRAMLLDTFDLARKLEPEIEIFACFTPDDAFNEEDAGSLFQNWKGRKFPQYEGDLGAKILGCFSTLRAIGFETIVVIGSDSPDLPLQRLQAAFERLEDRDAVIGESHDGGFYLLGSGKPLPHSLFNRVLWSGANVYRDVTMNLRMVGRLSFATLPTWHDVDEGEDIVQLRRRLFEIGTVAPHTKEFLSRNGE